MDWRFTLELIGVIGVLFNIFIDWPKFINRIKGIRDITNFNKPPALSAEKKYQISNSPSTSIAEIVLVVTLALIVLCSASLILLG